MIYEPAEDSFLLTKYVKQYARGKVLDMGCGSCIQAEAAAKKTKNITAVDINPEAVKLAEKSTQSNTLRPIRKSEREVQSDNIQPPYLPEEKGEDAESQLATTGGKKGNEVLKRFLEQAKRHLALEGHILIVVSSLTPQVEELFKKNGFEFRLLETKNLFFEKLMVYLLD